ncbi:hypothetical protein H5410_046272 [Solanum commersonii]|uniref:Uncharacterized protein n=1 Tax=Solanum commersonii TaxID=4109 RepID=A0A9J5XF72_SOLCO|nr:hypothetical protein H5410_046272 [Solanum commersonii]
MPGRPGKLRRKEGGETKKSGKLPRTGLAMTCSNCNARGEPSGSCNGRGNTSSSGRGRGKTSGSGKGRGRPKNILHLLHPTQPTPFAPPAPLTYPTLSAPPPPTATSLPTISKRGRPRKTPHAHPAYLEHPKPPAPPTSLPITSKRGRGRGSESTIPYKRSSIMGMSVFQVENEFKAFNPGMPSFKILSTSATKVTRSADITGDIGFKPSTTSKLTWKGKSTISTRKLQEMSEQRRKKPKGSSSNNPRNHGKCSIAALF